jgi:hypothetical protein
MPTMTKKHRIRLVDPQGGRSPTAGSASRRDKGRRSSRRKTEVVLRLLRGKTLDALSRELGVSCARLAEWRDEAIAAMQAGLQSREPDHRDGFIHRPQGQGRRPGHADRDPGGRSPPSAAEAVAVSQATSPSAKKPYGIQRVCRAWKHSRTTVQRCKPASPFVGEGYRKVWARLRQQHGIGTSRPSSACARRSGPPRAPCAVGIASSPSFVRQPEDNGCVERFIRTLKEQLLWLRRFRTVEELGQALRDFAQRFNHHWIIGRIGYRTPAQHRRELLGEAA